MEETLPTMMGQLMAQLTVQMMAQLMVQLMVQMMAQLMAQLIVQMMALAKLPQNQLKSLLLPFKARISSNSTHGLKQTIQPPHALSADLQSTTV